MELFKPKEVVEFDEELYQKNLEENSFEHGEEGIAGDGKGEDTNGGDNE